MDGLRQLRSVEEFAAKRGISVPEVLGLPKPAPKASAAPTEPAEPASPPEEAESNE